MYNQSRPLVMHIDLNSCFATIEQQARPLLRGRPVAIVNRRVDTAMIITASYEAKAVGVKLGMRLSQAKKLCPDLIGIESDAPKYKYIYHQLMRIMNDYSAHVRMKSIDEGVIDFSQTTAAMQSRDLVDIGYEIKQRLKQEIGVAMRCNVGIGTNRFLAKTAASLHKPDGLDVITADNLRATYAQLKLTDLTGIAERNQAKLQAVGIDTPLDFLDSSELVLRKIVFKSVDGTAWYKRLRGWEVDKLDHPLRSIGRQYVLDKRQMETSEILQRLHHLCEEVGRKLRYQGLVARGVQIHARGHDQSYHSKYWQNRHMATLPFHTDQAIYNQARQLYQTAPEFVSEIGITCYGLEKPSNNQLVLFGDEIAQAVAVTSAVDSINQRYGARSIHSADTLITNSLISEKIPFGSTRYM